MILISILLALVSFILGIFTGMIMLMWRLEERKMLKGEDKNDDKSKYFK